MLKATSDNIIPSITKLFNTSIELGDVRSHCKHALVTPLPKSCELSIDAQVQRFLEHESLQMNLLLEYWLQT